jgi:cellulose biosynthesis protein BcsQ
VSTLERHTAADVLLEPERFSLRDVVVRTAWGFDLAPMQTALASRESRRASADEFILRRQLADVVGYDVALVDSPPSLGLPTLNALRAALPHVVLSEHERLDRRRFRVHARLSQWRG